MDSIRENESTDTRLPMTWRVIQMLVVRLIMRTDSNEARITDLEKDYADIRREMDMRLGDGK